MQFRAADCGLIIFYLVHPTRKYKECLDTHIYTQIIPMFVYMKVPGPRLMCVILYLYYFSMSHVCTFIINTRVVYILSGATIENKSLAKPGQIAVFIITLQNLEATATGVQPDTRLEFVLLLCTPGTI